MDRERAGLVVLVIAAVTALAGSVPNWPASASTALATEEGEAPSAWTTHAYDISATEAILLGRFNPRGHRTIVQFQYGRTKAYGHIEPRYPEEEWYGEEVKGEEEVVECLRPRTRYHYRIVAKSKLGTAYGEDQTFRTRARHGPRFHEECNGRN